MKTRMFFGLMMAALTFSSCASYHLTAPVLGLGGNKVNAYAEADIDYSSAKKVSATVETSSFLGIPTIKNGNKTLRSSTHYSGLSKREAQALYRAKSESNVDLILDPEFETEKHSFFFGLIRSGKTTVTGWGVKVKGIKEDKH